MTALDVIKANRQALLKAGEKYGARHIRIFGSAARGEDRADSDLDFLVDMEQGRSLLDLVGLQQELERILGRRVDVVTEKGMNPHLREHVLSEAREL